MLQVGRSLFREGSLRELQEFFEAVAASEHVEAAGDEHDEPQYPFR